MTASQFRDYPRPSWTSLDHLGVSPDPPRPQRASRNLVETSKEVQTNPKKLEGLVWYVLFLINTDPAPRNSEFLFFSRDKRHQFHHGRIYNNCQKCSNNDRTTSRTSKWPSPTILTNARHNAIIWSGAHKYETGPGWQVFAQLGKQGTRCAKVNVLASAMGTIGC